MKILEAQSATLTNYEVYTHLTEQGQRYKAIRKQAEKEAAEKGQFKNGKPDPPGNVVHRPGNLWTLRREMIDYFHEAPSPLAHPQTYSENTICDLLKELRPWQITKGEVIMMLNLRPTKLENLNTIIQEMEDRFPGDMQVELLEAITKVLGRPDGEAERQKMAQDTKAEKDAARKEEQEQKEQLDNEMHKEL